jgi:hypothetical protein
MLNSLYLLQTWSPMKAIDLKAELQQLIESENDISILESLRILLKRTRMDNALKGALTSRAQESEKDIAEGRVLSKSDVITKLSA